MGLITVPQVADGDTAEAADINNPVNTIANEFNGNIDNANIKSGAAIATSKLASDGGITYAKLASGVAVQMAYSESGAVATGTTVMPYDDTIPQNTEGDQYMSLSITPKATTNILKIEIKANLSFNAATNMTGALFQDSTANALAAARGTRIEASGVGVLISITHFMVAGTTSSTTFKFRAGGSGAGTTTFNGEGGVRKFGGVMASSISITEYNA